MSEKNAGKGGKAPAKDGAPEPSKASGGMAAIAILAAGALVSSFATVYFLSPASVPDSAACVTPQLLVDTGSRIEPNQAYVELRDILITIGSAPATRYLKLKVAVISDKSNVATVEKAEPVLIDAYTNYLRSVEVSDFENPGFYSLMREQLGRRSQLVLGGDVSDGVLITEFLLR
ncbi:flagellar basal body-associated FliL family protein [Hyphomonas johnsonii]|jgi:flagellar FliL protein|uniref:Flagellar protein FliL n=1 Tax=Hyphomonas johnsonii MHS-2 TaxID=1280950 RepID=A0A059FP18_9PROT|nr:flagellar basal body-associated FliL family protein [Hyphomonas johnsonii]KCZ92208.1 flagellar basal body-associated protein FliL [Hyphomonas johnsonii MHS-2]